jgi:hypothetical protein
VAALSFLAQLDALTVSHPDVAAGLNDGLLDAPPEFVRALRRLKPDQAGDFLWEAIRYHDSWRGAWEASPDGLAAWLLAQQPILMDIA